MGYESTITLRNGIKLIVAVRRGSKRISDAPYVVELRWDYSQPPQLKNKVDWERLCEKATRVASKYLRSLMRISPDKKLLNTEVYCSKGLVIIGVSDWKTARKIYKDLKEVVRRTPVSK